MCSHILSDIEVLCDRVAILKGGKLAHLGELSDLQQQISGVEIVVSGTTDAALRPLLPEGNNFGLTPSPAGLRVEVSDEKDVDVVIESLRKAGGKLVSVQPLKQSLEELFLN
jgi:ABC-2 type transport system ATP-binding protein